MIFPKAIIFDLDDTILDDSRHVDACWQHGIALHASHLGEERMRLFMSQIEDERVLVWGTEALHKRGRLDLLETRRVVARGALKRMGIDDSALGDKVADAYSARREELFALFPGAVETVQSFRERGVKVGMITNGSANLQRAKIERFNLAPLFDYILVEGEFGAGKPEPAVYEHLIAQLGSAPEETWMVGDNLQWDVGGPQKLGILGIWVDIRRKGLPKGTDVRPHRIIHSITELIS